MFWTAWLMATLLPSLVGGDATSNGSADLDTMTTTIPRRLQGNQTSMSCGSRLKPFVPKIHKKSIYRIAMQAVGGLEKAKEEYNEVFSNYMTQTAGQRFDPPISFELVPIIDPGAVGPMIEEQSMDFFYVDPGSLSCTGVEVGAEALATIVSRVDVRGSQYDLNVFGGVIFTQADNDRINNIEDLRGKVIAASDIYDLMGAQVQLYTMQLNGLNFVMDPEQLVFTKSHDSVVQGVLNGDFDVGFVRTGQIEQTIDQRTGSLIDPDEFKILEPKIFVLDNGELFPFLHSTDVYPEWAVAALPHVPPDISREVQEALLALGTHAETGARMLRSQVWQPKRCDTTQSIAQTAHKATLDGKFAGFHTSKDYFPVRTMQESAGFLLKDESIKQWRCARAQTLYDSIECPAGHYKKPLADYEKSCQDAGLQCADGYDCYCQPCIKAFEVDVFFLAAGNNTESQVSDLAASQRRGCKKMSLCGEVEQTKTIKFMTVDNRQRPNSELRVLMHLDNDEFDLPVSKIGDYRWQFEWREDFVGVGIMELFIDEEQIPESPIRVQVIERDCEIDYPNQRRTNSNNGDCECGSGTWDIQGKCVNTSVMAAFLTICAVSVLAVCALLFLRYKNRKNDEMWHINVDELLLDDPPEIIGQGSFGVVVQAEYRGTKVAIKRVNRAHGTRHSRKGSRHSRSGSNKSKKRREQKRREETPSTPSPDSSDPTADISRSVSNISPQIIEEGFDEDDPEIGSVSIEDVTASIGGSVELLEDTNPQAGAALASVSDSKKHGAADTAFSFGFLASDFGGRDELQTNKLTGWLPWMKKDNYYQNRFKETILANDSSSFNNSASRSLFDRACRCFSEKAQQEDEFIAEMRVLSRLRHPCITTVMGAVVSNSHDPMLVMEFMEYGSLYDLLRNESMHLSGDVILQITRDTAQGLRYLHQSRPPIVHGDLKGRNILIDSRFRAKLCDFGMATKNKNLITGTPYWLAPEYLRNQVSYNPSCDMYSIGIILYEIYSRKNPYEGENFRDVLRKVCDKRINKRPGVPASCPPKMVELMKRCWSPDARVRPEAKDLDVALMDMNSSDAEPMRGDMASSQNLRQERRTGDMLYELFPKHIADALKAGQKVEPEQHDLVTVIFSDIVHFQEISQDLDPMKVSDMLDRLYLAFDKIARKHGVFKVETIGEAYMGVTNLEKSQQKTHVKQAAQFAIEMVLEAGKILVDEENPKKGYIKIRVGFHSGPVVSNVIGSLNPRYGLFGDTVNTASRMESNSRASRILCSEKSAKLLETQCPELPTTKRGKIAVKGKGDMLVFWVGDRIIINSVKTRKNSISAFIPMTPETADERQVKFAGHESFSNVTGSGDSNTNPKVDDSVVDGVITTLYGLLEKIVLAREQRAFVQQAMSSLARAEVELEKRNASKIVIKEMSDALLLPPFNEVNRSNILRIPIHPNVKAQLREYVVEISSMYRSVPFHNFRHAAHVVKSAATMMERIASSNGTTFDAVSTPEAKEMHERSYGICSDKIMQFGCVFSALIHDVDHTGLTNAELVNMGSALASAYQDRSVAEQNSLNVGWDVLMESKYRDLRACIYTNEMELKHFRKVLVNAIMATDIADKELKTMRESRWAQAFGDDDGGNKDKQMTTDRKASIVLEYVLQASDVGHTMQHWENYLVFNRRLFTERYLAWKNGHSGESAKDPSAGWYGGEIWFFDNYIIPLANRLKSSGALGMTADEYVTNAQNNRRKWEELGKDIVQDMLETCQKKYNILEDGPSKTPHVDYTSDEEVFSSQLSDC